VVSLRCEKLGLDYPTPDGALCAIDCVDALFPAGSTTAVVGPSGCGKTSLVRLMAGLIEPSRGGVSFDPPEAWPRGTRPRTAVMLQDYGLLPWKTVSANVELPLLIAGMGARERRERAAALVEELGLAGFERYFPARLSGGMRQRVALARALVQDPELLLMDEPFSSLDALTREAAQETLIELQRLRGTTAIIVTHSIEEAAYLADIIYVMRYKNPGRVVARITPREGTLRSRERTPSFRSDPAFLEYTSATRRALEGIA
jgi:NitT/TauT family transport system ATP-binding protein